MDEMYNAVQVTPSLINLLHISNQLSVVAIDHYSAYTGDRVIVVPCILVDDFRSSGSNFNTIEFVGDVAHFIMTNRNVEVRPGQNVRRVRLAYDRHDLMLHQLDKDIFDSYSSAFTVRYRAYVECNVYPNVSVMHMSNKMSLHRSNIPSWLNESERAKYRDAMELAEHQRMQANEQAHMNAAQYQNMVNGYPMTLSDVCKGQPKDKDAKFSWDLHGSESYPHSTNKSGRDIPLVKPDKEVKINVDKLNIRGHDTG